MTYPSLSPQYAAGQATSARVPSVPGAVTSACFDSGAVVYWNHPGDHAVTSFTVTPYIAGVAQGNTVTVNGNLRQATLTALANSTAYTFSVHAANTAGASGESAQSGANTPLANLIFGDDFTGPAGPAAGGAVSPCWNVMFRDGDQSNSEQQYYVPAQATLDGSSHLLLTAAVNASAWNTYNDANPPTYAGGLVTRPYVAAAVEWVYPGALSASGQAVSAFSVPGFNFTYGKIQVNAQIALLTAGTGSGAPAIWCEGSQCQTAQPLNPDNVAGSGGLTCNWHATGSEEFDIAEFVGGTGVASYQGNLFYNGGSFIPGQITVSNASTTYHTYEIDWSSGSLSWLLDGVSQQSTSTGVPATPMFLTMQNAIINGTVTLTQPVMSIDWVRVFHN